MSLHEVVNHAMREVPRLNPDNPALHFLQMLEAEGWTVVKKADVAFQQVSQQMLGPGYTDLSASQAMGTSLLSQSMAANLVPVIKVNATAERLIAEAKAKRNSKS